MESAVPSGMRIDGFSRVNRRSRNGRYNFRNAERKFDEIDSFPTADGNYCHDQ
jgi:hypothetical protein